MSNLKRVSGKVAVGISGGVDSSVAAILMKEAGWDVIGVHMLIHPGKTEAAEDAQKVADQLEIPLYHIDLIDEFEKRVATYLSKEYLNGKTPNPCIICNREIKFGLMVEQLIVAAGEFDYLVTGHFAQTRQLENGRWTIQKGTDNKKDQAYFLSMLSQDQIKKIHFPLFEIEKSEVRKIAADHSLFTSNKKESQDLCTGSYLDHIDSTSGKGPFIEETTQKELGKHLGIEKYTIGQRKGLNIATGYPIYVTRIDRATNTVYVGEDKELFSSKMEISGINWVGIETPSLPLPIQVKIRYRDSGTQATLIRLSEVEGIQKGIIEFEKPVRAITPGQLAVAYQENWVAFSGFIEKSLE